MRKIAKTSCIALLALFLLGCDFPIMTGFDLTPGTADEVTIAHVSDLHLRASTPLMDRMMEKLNELAPDAIVFTGDLVEDAECLPLLGGYLDRLNPLIPKYAAPTFMFSGHTHGGQITFFGIPIYLPPGSGGYCSGRYSKGNCVLYVSRGIGNNNSLDFRFFSDPELLVYGL
jgi:predicted MPP superfamily phosphohydrolase